MKLPRHLVFGAAHMDEGFGEVPETTMYKENKSG